MQDPSRILLLFVSRLVPRKGADTLLTAVAELPSQLTYEVHIVGEGRDRERLGRLAAQVGRPVFFHGRLKETEKIELYQAADLFVFPARDRWLGVEQEGFGIVILEAQACGLPVVIGSSGGTQEAHAPRSGGLLRRGDPAELRAVLSRLLRDPEQLNARREPASAYMAQHFDYDQLSRAYASALDVLVNG
jgi:phosphatidylinositol alpha-1,6-mannosyltransferase